MSPKVQMISHAPAIQQAPATPLPALSGDQVSEQLDACAKLVRDHVRGLPPKTEAASLASRWLRDNQAFLQSQIAELKQTLRPAYFEKLVRSTTGEFLGEPRIYRIAAQLVADSGGMVDSEILLPFAETVRQEPLLSVTDLWAFPSMLKLALVQWLCADLGAERRVPGCIRSLWALEAVPWRNFVESASRVEAVLRRDPTGVYARMDFATRERYRAELKKIAEASKRTEEEVALAALQTAERARTAMHRDSRTFHVGYYLAGPGAKQFRRRIGCKRSTVALLSEGIERFPTLCYAASILTLSALVLAGFRWITGPFLWWMLALLFVPASQAALEIINAAISRLLEPRAVFSMDFSDGVPNDCKTMVVVPTLLLSEDASAKLLKDLEIRYLANRGRNVFFALLTDFPDADRQEVERDCVLDSCVEGIQALNSRYGEGGRGPFYLFHRARRWNPKEGKWMGYERKRGKLNDLNKLLLGKGNWFDTIEGDASRLLEIRYVVTLDTDTQLPRDTAAKLAAAMAHPLNRPILDTETGIVVEGYALLRPQIAISVESARRSWITRIFGGQPGFDPYGSSVSDVYHDLHGQASFTGKGIYDVAAFDAAVGERFPEDAILSHDLIEGEHARTGLLNSVELVEDYPATYRAFTKRKHRWVRGDWQLLPWLFAHPPGPGGRAAKNPLSAISRWKILDNLRRSLWEISLLLLLVSGWMLLPTGARWTVAVLLLMQTPVYIDMAFSVMGAPERRFWGGFGKNLGTRFLVSHRDTLLILAFVPHQACLMADAILRTLWRRYVSGASLLEWETMAESELTSSSRLGVFQLYLYASSLVWLPFLFLAGPMPILVALVCAFWITAPMVAAWLNEPLPKAAAISPKDRSFLRESALRTWRYFADHSTPENNWLVPDNVQEDPPLTAHNISPTNLGLLLTSQLAALDFGYLTVDELARSLPRIFDSMDGMPRQRGHFFNWCETRSLRPLTPRYISSVDSGNLAASLTALRQGCLLSLEQPVLERSVLDGIRDHALRLRDELPYEWRTFSTMKLFGTLLRQLECQPNDLFLWEAVLTESRDLVRRIEAALVSVQARLNSEGIRYWEGLLSERVDSALSLLYQLAPWLGPEFEPELRAGMRDASLTPLIAELSRVRNLGDLPNAYDRIRERLGERLRNSRPLYPALRSALEDLVDRLPAAGAAALEVSCRLEESAARAERYFDDMDFSFLFDENRQMLRIGYDADKDRVDQSCYDLLASEARTTVFLAIAKGDIPRETWLRLGRKLTAYRDHVTLLAWSGTMFEYLMPMIHLRSQTDTLLDRATRAAVRIQQVYAEERRVPWGISEAAYSDRDAVTRQYQYRAFGVPPLCASGESADRLVIAPYASMLALMVDPARSIANLRFMASKGWWGRHGFYESIDYAHAESDGAPEVVRCFMAHHQGMSLLAIDNALLGNRMQERFHHDPLVQSTEFLLEERMPTLVDVSPVAAAEPLEA